MKKIAILLLSTFLLTSCNTLKHQGAVEVFSKLPEPTTQESLDIVYIEKSCPLEATCLPNETFADILNYINNLLSQKKTYYERYYEIKDILYGENK